MKPTLAALLAVLGILSSQAAAATKPWNILFCFADDWGRYANIGELDNTLIVISGDHGMPGVPGGKCNLYDFGVGVALIEACPAAKAAGSWTIS